MKQVLKTLCAVGAMLYAGDVSAMDVVNAHSTKKNSNSGNVELIREIEGFPVVVEDLKNEECRKIGKDGEKETVWGSRKERLQGIVYLGSVGTRDENIRNTYLNNGTSTNFMVVLRDGRWVVVQLADENKKTYHSGISHGFGFSRLNETHVGIMFETPVVFDREYKEGYGNLVQYYGDNTIWYRPTKESVDVLANFIKALSRHLGLSEKDVVPSNSIKVMGFLAPGPDLHPMLAKRGAVWWPDSKNYDFGKASRKLEDSDFMELVRLIGINRGKDGIRFENRTNQDILRAFKFMYLVETEKGGAVQSRKMSGDHIVEYDPSRDLSGELTDKTKKVIIDVVASRSNSDKDFKEIINDSFISEAGEKAEGLNHVIEHWNEFEKVESK